MPTQWVKASLWGERGEKLQPYLHKGAQIFVQLADLHIETFAKKDGSPGFDLRARIDNVQLVGDRKQEQREAAKAALSGVYDQFRDSFTPGLVEAIERKA
jgi:single-strand DNA-binding protein